MKKIYALIVGLATVAATLGFGLMPANAAVNVTAIPVALVTSPVILAPSSAQTALFSFSLSNTATETLSSVLVNINNVSGNVTAGQLSSVSIYKDDGSNVFNPVVGNLVGSQNTLTIGSPSTVSPATTTQASGKFYISLATSGSWGNVNPADSMTVTLPANAIVTSANSPATSAVTTATISSAPIAGAVVSTTVEDSNNLATSTAAINSVVHDSATVSSASGPTPTGSVTFSFFNNAICSGNAAATSGALALTSGSVNATGFAQGPLAAGSYSFRASYSGDANYSAVSGSCEPLTISSVIQTTTCSNGIVNGATYQMTGKDGGKFLGVNCTLQPVVKPGKGNGKGHKDNDGDADDQGGNSHLPLVPLNPNHGKFKVNFGGRLGNIFHLGNKKGGK